MKMTRPDHADRRARIRLRCALGVAAGALLVATHASALGDGTWTLFVEGNVAHDDNVFRVPKARQLPPGAEEPQRGDFYYTTLLGIKFDRPVGRQRFQLSFTGNDTRYDHYDSLDYTGYDARALWLWQLGNDAHGQLGYTDTSAPPSFADVPGSANDLLHTRQAFLNAIVAVTPRWRLQGGVNGLVQTNNNEFSQVDDVDIVTADASVSYVTPANTSIGLVGRYEHGRYPNRDFGSGSALPDAYRQYNIGLAFDWTITEKSHLSGRIEHASRRYDDSAAPDFNGAVGRIEFEWKPTGKFSLLTVARREINPYRDTRANFMLVKGITLTPLLRATAKIDVSGVLDYSERTYRGGFQLACGVAPGSSDRIRSGTLFVAYRPESWISLTLSAQRQSCSSDVPLGDYVANIFALGVRLTF